MYNGNQYGINDKFEELENMKYSRESIKQNNRLLALDKYWEDEYGDLYEYIVDED